MRLADDMSTRLHEWGVVVSPVFRTRVIDAGVKAPGSIAAGLAMARICLADLASVSLVPSQVGGIPLPGVAVNVNMPVAACMASQYAGWKIAQGDYFAM